MSLLGIDIGSGSCKGVVFDEDGNILASSSHGYSTYSPSPNWVEMDADLFWDAVVKVTRQVAGMVPNNPVEALSISSHGETVIPVDREGNAVAPAIMNSDNRAMEEVQEWEKNLGKHRIYEITGLPLHSMFALNKILWIKRNRPEIYERADRFVSVGDYILLKMDLPPYTDHSLACRTMAFDIMKRKWSDEILNCAGISKERLSIPLPSGQSAGKISQSTAAVLGLKEGVIVAMGGHDQPCGALGAGTINPGDVSDSAGSYECLAAVSDCPVNNDRALSYSLNSYCHVIPGMYITLAFFPAGITSRWFTDQFCFEDRILAEKNGKSLHDVLDEIIPVNCPGPTGLCITPHFVGSCNPNWDVRATGAAVGFTPYTTRHHFYKAIYEGIACELALNADILEEVAGKFDTVRIHGGNSRSDFTLQLRADITGLKLQTLVTSEAVCQGAAILAGIAAGFYRDTQEAAVRVVKIGNTYSPDIDSANAYMSQINRYRLLYPSLERIWEMPLNTCQT